MPCVTRIAVKYVKLEGGCLIVGCAPRKGQARRCAECGKKAPVHDCSTEPRRWRSLDLGTTKTFIEHATVRVACPTCGAHAAAVPRAHRASRFTRAFEEQVAWLCVHCSRSVVASLMRIDRKSVGPVCGRVRERPDKAAGNRFDGLARIGVDETSYKKGHKYMTVVVNHDTQINREDGLWLQGYRQSHCPHHAALLQFANRFATKLDTLITHRNWRSL